MRHYNASMSSVTSDVYTKKDIRFRMVRIRKRESDPDSVAPKFWQGSRRRSPPGVADNLIKTTKYNIFSFLPQNLFEQFRRLFNVYWLLQCIIVLIPGFSPVSPYSTIGGFVFVLGVTCVKDAYEDYQRYLSDCEANNLPVQILRDGKLKPTASMSLLVGDVILVRKEEPFPADLAILSCSDPQDICYIETSNLDGERNLKRFYSMSPTSAFKTGEEINKNLVCSLLVEPPNQRLYKFVGQLHMGVSMPTPAASDAPHVSPINAENVCLRGSRLKQTESMFGVVVYAGMESKLSMNSRLAKSKFSQVDRLLNSYIIYLFALDLAICVGLTLGSVGSFPSSQDKWYLVPGKTNQASMLYNLFSYFVLLSSFIPLSLMVSLELASFAQALFMMWDDDMRTERGPMRVMSSALNTDLGQVEYVFCDKTGTLTQNRMSFRHASVHGNKFLKPMLGQLGETVEARGAAAGAIGDYLRVLALCNEVIPEDLPLDHQVGDHETDVMAAQDASGRRRLLRLNSSSPDEVALVQAAAANQVVLLGRTARGATLVERGREAEYATLAVLDFNSERRRMSVVVRSPEGECLLLTKGADQVMLPLCRKETPPEVLEASLTHMDRFASQGFRVMLVSARRVPEAEYERFAGLLKEASTSMDDRRGRVEAAYGLIERDLSCVGVTCVEDQLQEQVRETVQYMLRGGMHVWILTGDKLETAVTIAYSSSIVDAKTALSLVDGPDWDTVQPQLEAAAATPPLSGGKALLVGGQALALARERDPAALVGLCRSCRVVVCARCAPVQKSDVVQLVMRELGKVCLAVGDGGNDVPMIKTAHIGVGIMGNEGLQAARSSDFAIGEFRLLRKLLSVHGRYSALRTTDLIKYSFYKNVALCVPQIAFAFASLHGASSLLNSWVILAYNTLFTGLPPLALATLEKDLPEHALARYPELYCTPERRRPLTARALLFWEAHAVWQGAAVFLAVLYSTQGLGGYEGDGRDVSLDVVGFLVAQAAFLAVMVHMGLVMRTWTWVTAGVMLACLGAFFAALGLLDFLFCPERNEPVPACGVAVSQVLAQPRSWLIMLLTLAATAVPKLASACALRTWHPEPWQVLQEVDCQGGAAALDRLDPARAGRFGCGPRDTDAPGPDTPSAGPAPSLAPL